GICNHDKPKYDGELNVDNCRLFVNPEAAMQQIINDSKFQ
ncbi:11748_t:CDS:1, partial [Dentiscutata heterogama]